MTQALRRENAQLRQANAALVVENIGYQKRLSEAHSRVSALLEQIPALDGGGETDAEAEAGTEVDADADATGAMPDQEHHQ